MENRVLPIVSTVSSFFLFFLGVKQNKAKLFFPFFPLWGGSVSQGHSSRSDGLGVSMKGKHCRVPQSSALALPLWNFDTQMAKVRAARRGRVLGLAFFARSQVAQTPNSWTPMHSGTYLA